MKFVIICILLYISQTDGIDYDEKGGVDETSTETEETNNRNGESQTNDPITTLPVPEVRDLISESEFVRSGELHKGLLIIEASLSDNSHLEEQPDREYRSTLTISKESNPKVNIEDMVNNNRDSNFDLDTEDIISIGERTAEILDDFDQLESEAESKEKSFNVEDSKSSYKTNRKVLHDDVLDLEARMGEDSHEEEHFEIKSAQSDSGGITEPSVPFDSHRFVTFASRNQNHHLNKFRPKTFPIVTFVSQEDIHRSYNLKESPQNKNNDRSIEDRLTDRNYLVHPMQNSYPYEPQGSTTPFPMLQKPITPSSQVDRLFSKLIEASSLPKNMNIRQDYVYPTLPPVYNPLNIHMPHKKLPIYNLMLPKVQYYSI